jgi:hypothetical protein
MTDSQRNLLILLAVAVVGVLFSGAFNVGAGIAGLLLNLAFTVVILWFLITLYQRHSGTIAQMPTTPRLVLQVAGVVLFGSLVTGMLHAPFLPFPFGWSSDYPMIFWPLVLGCAFAIWWAWQQRTSRW